jgi:3'-phosphoadenosine 5'-phosphosulfate sulfotransferase (PAPS reductase)/FAD synthetase
MPIPFRPTAIVMCDSGGKDSTLKSHLVAEIYKGVCPIIIHHQLIPEEWPGTREYVEATAKRLGVELVVEQALYYGFQCGFCGNRYTTSKFEKKYCPKCKSLAHHIATIQGLMDLVEWRGMYPDSSIRWCTSYLKRDLFNSWVRRNRKLLGDLPVVTLGERHLESIGRSKLPEIRKRSGLSEVIEYRPILNLRRIDVFRGLRDRGIEPHYCYRLQGMTDADMYEIDAEGGPRCSCINCIYLTPANIDRNLRLPMNFDLRDRMLRFEENTGFTYKPGLGIAEILSGNYSTSRSKRKSA